MNQKIEILTEFANRESSDNIVGWGAIRSTLADAVNCFEREIPIRGTKSGSIVTCPSCNEKNIVAKERFFIYCQACGRKIVK